MPPFIHESMTCPDRRSGLFLVAAFKACCRSRPTSRATNPPDALASARDYEATLRAAQAGQLGGIATAGMMEFLRCCGKEIWAAEMSHMSLQCYRPRPAPSRPSIEPPRQPTWLGAWRLALRPWDSRVLPTPIRMLFERFEPTRRWPPGRQD